MKFNASIAVNLATSAKFAHTIGPAMTIALIVAFDHPLLVAIIAIRTEINLHQGLEAQKLLGLTHRAFQTKLSNSLSTLTLVLCRFIDVRLWICHFKHAVPVFY